MIITFTTLLLSSCFSVGQSAIVEQMAFKVVDSTMRPCPSMGGFNQASANNDTFSQINVHQSGVSDVRLSQVSVLLSANQRQADVIYLPGCFDVAFTATSDVPVEDLYVELTVGGSGLLQKSPCEDQQTSRYCQQSDNHIVRYWTYGQHTCKFCNLCKSNDGKKIDVKNGDILKRSLGIEAECGHGDKGGSVPVRLSNVCTPSRAEVENEMRRMYGYNWQSLMKSYGERGSLSLTIHVLKREKRLPEACTQLDTGVQTQNFFYRYSLIRRCAQLKPTDSYLACYQANVLFTII